MKKELRQLLQEFSSLDTQQWFEARGVQLKTEEDGRLFPESNTSQTIIDCFTKEVQKKNITVKTSCAVLTAQKDRDIFHLTTSEETIRTKYILACTGGSQKQQSLSMAKSISSISNTSLPFSVYLQCSRSCA